MSSRSPWYRFVYIRGHDFYQAVTCKSCPPPCYVYSFLNLPHSFNPECKISRKKTWYKKQRWDKPKFFRVREDAKINSPEDRARYRA